MTDETAFLSGLEGKRAAVKAAKKALENAKKKLETLESELRGWEEAAEHMKALASSSASPALSSSPTADGKRGLSEPWKRVMVDIARAWPRDFSLPEIAAICEKHGIAAQADTIRGQTHHHASETQFLERTSPGRFKITPKGAAVVGVRFNREVSIDDDIPF
jgi:hypothetical protein